MTLFAGVIEGFYGQPWAQPDRLELFARMSAWGLNTYVYAPKDDLKHRAIWRQLYTEAELTILSQLISACKQHKLRFIYALSPGLDIHYSAPADLSHLKARLQQLLALGCEDFCLLFDDIPDRIESQDLEQFGSLASAQSQITNAIFGWLRERSPSSRLLFCPTAYCGRMADNQLGGENYLAIIGQELLPEIDVFWTGPEIISQQITVSHIQQLQRVLRRKPVIWDNLHANDYDGRRFFCGPYSGRPPELRSEVNGFLSNPNCEFPLNFVPVRTLASYIACDANWEPREAFLSALREWLPHFAMIGQPISLDDLIAFADCYYLPHEEGPQAKDLLMTASRLLSRHAADWAEQAPVFRQQAARLRDFCVRLTELRDRSLFYALSRRIWDLREELDLLERFVAFKSEPANANVPFRSGFHLPGTFRGGVIADLQHLLIEQPDGTFVPTAVRG